MNTQSRFQQRRRSSALRTVTICGIVAALLISQTVALAGTGDTTFATRSARVAGSQPVEAFAVLTPQPGNDLRFVEIHVGDGGIAGVGVAEVVSAGVDSALNLDQLRGANPLEVFNALSRKGEPFPALLTELYGEPVLGQQGWATKDGTYSDPGSTTVSFTFPEEQKTYPRKSGCQTRTGSYPAAWTEPLKYGVDNFSSNYIAPMSGPVITPADWIPASNPMALNDGGPYHDFAGQANSVTAFSTSIMLCDTAFFYSIDGNLVGKNVVLFTRPATAPGSPVWQNEYGLGALDAVDKVITFQFHPADFESALAFRLDFRLEIQGASAATSLTGAGKQGDRFYIGAVWHEMTNGEFPTR